MTIVMVGGIFYATIGIVIDICIYWINTSTTRPTRRIHTRRRWIITPSIFKIICPLETSSLVVLLDLHRRRHQNLLLFSSLLTTAIIRCYRQPYISIIIRYIHESLLIQQSCVDITIMWWNCFYPSISSLLRRQIANVILVWCWLLLRILLPPPLYSSVATVVVDKTSGASNNNRNSFIIFSWNSTDTVLVIQHHHHRHHLIQVYAIIPIKGTK